MNSEPLSWVRCDWWLCGRYTEEKKKNLDTGGKLMHVRGSFGKALTLRFVGRTGLVLGHGHGESIMAMLQNLDLMMWLCLNIFLTLISTP